MTGNRIIVHALIKINNKYLVTKRSLEEEVYANYWDIPGGLVEYGELPTNVLIREVKEEVGLDVDIIKIIHEDSNFDQKKDMIFIRLVYLCKLKKANQTINLDKKEHSKYLMINKAEDLHNEKIVPFLKKVIFND